MHWFAILIAAAIGLFVLDRLALWMKERGWLYHRKTRNRPADPPEPDKERDGE